MDDSHLPELSADDLQHCAQSKPSACNCSLKACLGWESVSQDRWPAQQLQAVGTLRRPVPVGQTEPTFEEFHPHGTRYESPQAPIALAYFPFNRCDVHACTRCGCAVLRYTEYGAITSTPVHGWWTHPWWCQTRTTLLGEPKGCLASSSPLHRPCRRLQQQLIKRQV